MLSGIATILIRRSEKRLGVTFDYVHKIAQTDFRLLLRYNRIFGLVDPNRHVPALAYHAARIRSALGSDCGACVEAAINGAKNDSIGTTHISAILSADETELPENIYAVLKLTDAVTRDRIDDPDSREIIRTAWGEKGVIELALVMNGEAFLPGVKRAMGFATSCNIDLMQKTLKQGN